MSAATRQAVLERDRGCVAPRVDPNAGPCGDVNRLEPYVLEVDHVRPHAGSLTVSDPRWCVTLCTFHHRGRDRRGSVWATGHRQLLRDHLAALVAP